MSNKTKLVPISWAPHISLARSAKVADFYLLLILLVPIGFRIYNWPNSNYNFLYLSISLIALGLFADLCFGHSKQKKYAFSFSNTLQSAAILLLLPSTANIATACFIVLLTFLIYNFAFNHYNISIASPALLSILLFYQKDGSMVSYSSNLINLDLLSYQYDDYYIVAFIALLSIYLLIFKRDLIFKIISFLVLYTLFSIVVMMIKYNVLNYSQTILEYFSYSNVYLSSILLLSLSNYYPTGRISRVLFIISLAMATVILELTDFKEVAFALSLFSMSIVTIGFYLREEDFFIKNFEEKVLSKIEVGEDI